MTKRTRRKSGSEVSGTSRWDDLAECFDGTLQRRTSIFLKPSDGSRQYAYPSHAGELGYHFEEQMFASYQEDPYLSVRLAPFFFPSISGAFASACPVAWRQQVYRPDCVSRSALLPNAGMEIEDTFCRPRDGGFVWNWTLRSRAWYNWLPRFLYVVVSSPALNDFRVMKGGFSFRPSHPPMEKGADGQLQRISAGQGIDVRPALDRRKDGLAGTFRMYLAAQYSEWGTYDTVEAYRHDVGRGCLNGRTKGTRHLVLAIEIAAPRVRAKADRDSFTATQMGIRSATAIRRSFGISYRSLHHARALADIRRPEALVERRWNKWFERLPRLRTADDASHRAYAKCWWASRLLRYDHPRFGRTMVESPCYPPGYWVVNQPSMEFLSRQDPEDRGHSFRAVMDMFCRAMSRKGVFPHAVYLSDRKYGERWLSNTRQVGSIPNTAWAVLMFAMSSKDRASVRRWYPYLIRYYRHLCDEHDSDSLNLWSINHVHDTFDTTPTSEGVRTGREPYCYPPEYAAERVIYEQSLAKLAELLKMKAEATEYQQAAKLSLRALRRHLWDPKRGWFGVRHADGSLDSRIGVPGLFPLAYGLATAAQARAARSNVLKLLAPHGVRTFAPGQPGYSENYWRGPVWSTSILYASGVARVWKDRRLADRIRRGLVRYVLSNPNIWELLEGDSGEPAATDYGFISASVMGGASLCGSGALVMAFHELDGEALLPRLER